MKIKFYILSILFTTTFFAQQNQVETKIDKKINKIGAQFNLTLKTTVDTLSTVVFPNAKSFGSLEVIRNYVIDTVKKDAKYELIKRYGLTQFDSGHYVIPKMVVMIDKKPYYSDSIAIKVQDVLVDTLKQKMYDIKPISQAGNTSSNWWKYLLGFLLLIGIGALIYYLFKKYQKKKSEELVFKTPIEKAIGMLKILETKQLWQKGEIKNYYSELTDIARNYIEEVIEIPAKESTTSELIASMKKAVNSKKLTFTKQSFSNLENVLKQADLVKFAKVEPSQNQIEEDYKRIEKSIISIHQSIPTEVVEEEDGVVNSELQKAKLLKKQKTNRIIMAVCSVLFLIFATTAYFVFTKGFDYVKDNVIGHPSMELLEGKWVNSEYGNPGIYISTPKVLMRIDSQKALPKEAFAILKEMEMFGYGSLIDNFYVMVSTAKFKQETKIDFNTVIDGNVKTWEAQGCQNILVKQEEFNTEKGISGVHAYGPMSILDKVHNKTQRLLYDFLLFKQDEGLQQIVIVHKEGDKYAEQILARIKNSVELKSAKQ